MIIDKLWDLIVSPFRSGVFFLRTWFVRPWVLVRWVPDRGWVIVSDHWTWDSGVWASEDLKDVDPGIKVHVMHKNLFYSLKY